MKKASIKLFKAIIPVLVLSAFPVHGMEFSADLIITGSNQNFIFQLAVKDNMYRLHKLKGDTRFPPYPIIVNADSGVTWGLNPLINQYVELTDVDIIKLMNPIVGWRQTWKDWPMKYGGTEKLNGYECRKMLYFKPYSMLEAEVWISQELGHFIKQVLYGAYYYAVMELRNISIEPLDNSLFKIPKGFTRMEPSVTPTKNGKVKIIADKSRAANFLTATDKIPSRNDTSTARGGSEENDTAPALAVTAKSACVPNDKKEPGTIIILPTKKGRPFPAEVFCYRSGGKKRIFNGKTDKETGLIKKVPAGHYDIKVVDFRRDGKPFIKVKKIKVLSGNTVTKRVEFIK